MHRQVCEALDAPCITAMRGDRPEPRCTVHHAHARRPVRAPMHRASSQANNGRLPTPMHRASAVIQDTRCTVHHRNAGRPVNAPMHRASPQPKADSDRHRCTVHHRDAGRPARASMHRASRPCGMTGRCSDARCITVAKRRAATDPDAPCITTTQKRMATDTDAPCIGKSARHSMHRASPQARGGRLPTPMHRASVVIQDTRCTVHHRDAGRRASAPMHGASPRSRRAAIDPDARCITPARPIRRPAARAARGGAGEALGATAGNPTAANPPAAARIGLLCTTFPRGPSRYPFLPKPRRRPKASQPTRRFFIRILPFLIEGFRGDTPSCSTSCGSVRSYCTHVKR